MKPTSPVAAPGPKTQAEKQPVMGTPAAGPTVKLAVPLAPPVEGKGASAPPAAKVPGAPRVVPAKTAPPKVPVSSKPSGAKGGNP